MLPLVTDRGRVGRVATSSYGPNGLGDYASGANGPDGASMLPYTSVVTLLVVVFYLFDLLAVAVALRLGSDG